MPSPPALSFSPTLSLLGEGGGMPGGGGMAGERPGATLCMGDNGSPGSTHKFCAAPRGTCAVVKYQATKFNWEPALALMSGTYLSIETKPGVLSAMMVCLPVEAVTNEETSLEQWLSQRHTFDQWEAVFRTILTSLKDPTGHKTLSPADVQDILNTAKRLLCLISLLLEHGAKQAKLNLIKTQLKAASAALAEQLKELRIHLIQSEMKVEELDLSSLDLQLTTIKLITGQ
eukprot:jgi/Psemu1/24892/gm1.24892_g